MQSIPKMGQDLMLKSQEGVQITTTMTQDTQTDFRNDYFRHFPQGIPVPLHGVRIKVEDGTIAGCATTKRKLSVDEADSVIAREIKKAKLETKALKAKRPGFTDERYNETSYFVENGLRKVYPYYFTFTTFTKGRWVGEKILDVFAREFRAHPVEEYERCIKSGTLTVNYTKVGTDYRLKHNDLLANIVHRHEVPVTADPIEVVYMDDDLVVVDKPASIPVHPCGRYRHNTMVFILAKEYQLKNLRTIHRLDRLTSGLLLFGRNPKKAREMEQQIRNRVVSKEYVCRVEGEFPDGEIECSEPILVVSYKIGVCKVAKDGKDCKTTFKKLSSNGKTSVVSAKPRTGRMHQIRVHLQYLGYPIINDPLYNHPVFGPEKGKAGVIGKSDEQLIQDLISIHNAENWLGIESEESGGRGGDMFGPPTSKPTGSQVLGMIPPSLNFKSSPDEDDDDDDSDIGTRNAVNLLEGDDSASPSCGDGGVGGEKECETKEEQFTNNSELKDLPTVQRGADHGTVGLKCDTDLVSLLVPAEKVTVGTQTCSEDEILGNVCSSGTTSSTTIACTTIGTCVKEGNEGEGKAAETGGVVDCGSCSSELNQPLLLKDNNNSSITDCEDYNKERMTYDQHCYECKVRYRDPKPKDLIMYLHCQRYSGPEWEYTTKLPPWAAADWVEPD
ncbi:RNA pseudouridylate synthase domain-containing protein 2 isoform X2 [Folsomia candida]|uniref:RNA pseudouridylate synthase domain-containing protein 2 isoform X2 n=1 Tax=Folsomia candida TaxID=158441 RepID=UPI000B8F1A78|nr:RNA pseudouridylate synthase domain-containing protein 2 isoform X2 [Folsomia candida]